MDENISKLPVYRSADSFSWAKQKLNNQNITNHKRVKHKWNTATKCYKGKVGELFSPSRDVTRSETNPSVSVFDSDHTQNEERGQQEKVITIKGLKLQVSTLWVLCTGRSRSCRAWTLLPAGSTRTGCT